VYVHGFATTFDSALYRLAQLKYDTGYPGVPIAFCWPSAGEESWTAYNHDRESVPKSIHAFSDLLRLLKASAYVSKLYIIAHSMGGQIVTSRIDAAGNEAKKMALEELVLAAPDVDPEFFSEAAPYLKQAVKKVTLYALSTDRALWFSAGLNGEKKSRLGYHPPGTGPHTFPDIETIDVTALESDMFGRFTINRDIPFNNRSTLGDIARLLRYGIHPPDDRSPGEISGAPPGTNPPDYWEFPR